jgi:hypothetical protein
LEHEILTALNRSAMTTLRVMADEDRLSWWNMFHQIIGAPYGIRCGAACCLGATLVPFDSLLSFCFKVVHVDSFGLIELCY